MTAPGSIACDASAPAGYAEAGVLVAAQIARYQELLVLLEMERDAVEQQNMTLVGGITAQKQPLIDAIVAEEGRLNPFRHRAARERHAGDGCGADEAARAYWEHSHDLGTLMREAVSSQHANETLLGARMEAVRARIRSLGHGQQSLSGYGATTRGKPLEHLPRLIDRQR